MLHLETLDAGTQSLLQRLMEEPSFQQLRLVGGTALALLIGHRKSIDLDLFGRLEKDNRELPLTMKQFGVTTPIQSGTHIHVYVANGVKVDIVQYGYDWLQPAIVEGDWRLAAMEDIAAIKLSAVTGRGTKKDFIDLYFLLQRFSLAQLLDFYEQKYKDGSTFLVLKSLQYFEDAEPELMPEMIIQVDWTLVKRTISNEVNRFVRG